MRKLIPFFLTLVSMNLFAISEVDYQTTYKEKIIPLILKMGEGQFKSNNVNIHYRTLIQKDATSCLIILPGRTEAAEKYAELVYDINQSELGKNLNYFILDHRGQGSSDRMASKLDMGHVDHFENYVSDLETFLALVVKPSNCQKKFLFAHSMGAGIGLTFSVSNPMYFDAMAISSPMLKIQTKPYPYLVAKTIVTSMKAIGRGDEFAIGQSGYDANEDFVGNKFTTSKERFDMSMNIFKVFPKTQLGGVSNQWIFEIMNGTRKIRNSYNKLIAPIRLYRAGIELYSEPKEMHKMCAEAVQCEELVLETAKHEVYNDSDLNRDQVMNSIIELFSKI